MLASFFIRRPVRGVFIAALILFATFAYFRCNERCSQRNEQKRQELFNANWMSRNASLAQKYNAVEDAHLQEYIALRKHKIKAVIYILVRADRIKQLRLSIELLYKNSNQRYGYPIILFHEADFLPLVESVRQIGAISGSVSAIFFQLVDLRVPEWHIKSFGMPSASTSLLVLDKGCSLAGVGYRSMCRFQGKLVYEQTIFRHFEYYWRLDDDSRISSNITYDVFDVLMTGGFSYGFVKTTIDECAHKIFDVAESYMKSKGIIPTFYHKLKRDEMFFNNFEVSSFKFWRSEQYRDYIEHIDSLGGIYTHRWGDAPIKTLALSAFVPLREIFRFRNFTYLHGVRELGGDLVTDFVV